MTSCPYCASLLTPHPEPCEWCTRTVSKGSPLHAHRAQREAERAQAEQQNT